MADNVSTTGVPFKSPSFTGTAVVNNNALSISPLSTDLMLLNGVDGATTYLSLYSYGAVETGILTRQAGGTQASKTASVNGQSLFRMLASGYNGSAYRGSGGLNFITTETWTSTTRGTKIQFQGSVTGSNSLTTFMELTDSNAIVTGTVKSTGLVITSTLCSATAPTVSGFGASPTVPENNGTCAFTINVGTGGLASTGTITLPAAAAGWACNIQNVTSPATYITSQTGGTTTTATVTNYSRTTGLEMAWAASDVLRVSCFGY